MLVLVFVAILIYNLCDLKLGSYFSFSITVTRVRMGRRGVDIVLKEMREGMNDEKKNIGKGRWESMLQRSEPRSRINKSQHEHRMERNEHDNDMHDQAVFLSSGKLLSVGKRRSSTKTRRKKRKSLGEGRSVSL